MSSRIRKTCTGALALFMALWLSGGHLVLLQVTAWSGMMLTRTMENGVGEALATTFDGEHPCKLCKAIKRTQEKEQSPTVPAPLKNLGKLKIEATLSGGRMALTPPSPIAEAGWQDMIPATASLDREPPVPPPRLAA